MRHLKRALVAAALGLAASGAAAQDMVVKYDDLDLTSAKDQKALERRIDAAARTFCKVKGLQTGSRVNRAQTSCIAQAREDARSQMAALIGRQALPGG